MVVITTTPWYHYTTVAFFLISGMVLGLLDQLLIFSQLYLIELRGLLTGLGLLELWHLVYPRLLTRFWNAGLLHKLKLYGISRQIFGFISSVFSSTQL